MKKVESLSNLKVVYVERDIKLQTLVKKYLTEIFDNLYVYSDSIEGLKQCKRAKPDILITNIDHAKLNGVELIRGAKQLNPQTEAIIISSTDDKKLIIDALRLDVIDIIDKPFEFPTLDAALIKAGNNINQKQEFIELKRKSIAQEIENDGANIYKIFEMLKRDDIPVDIINFYKGVPIINTGFIKEVKEDAILMQTQSLQKLVMSLESFINIESKVLPKPIKFDVSDMKSYAEPVKLGNPKVKDFSLRRRKDIRLAPDDSFSLSLLCDNHTIPVTVDDVSTQLITFSVVNIEDKDLLDDGNEVESSLSFDLDKHGAVNINFKSEIKILKRGEKQRIYAIQPIFDTEQQEDLNQYLLQREFQIINELKNLRLINGI